MEKYEDITELEREQKLTTEPRAERQADGEVVGVFHESDGNLKFRYVDDEAVEVVSDDRKTG